MRAEDLLELIDEYNSNKEEMFDKCADIFISQARKELEKVYSCGKWTQMVSVTQLGIVIENLSEDFQKFSFDILSGYFMRWGKTIHSEYQFPTFQEFTENKEYENMELYGFHDEDILQIQPLYEALRKKGFECYVDKENYQLIIALDIN